MQLKDNRFTKAFIAYIDKIRRNLSYTAVIGVIAGVVIAICTYSIYQAKTSSYIVTVNNKAVGYVKGIDDINTMLKSIKSTDGEKPLKSIAYKKTNDSVKNLMGLNEIEKAVRYELGLKMHAVVIYANGIELAKVYDKDTAEKVLKGVKEYYYPKLSNGTFSIVSSKIKEEITFSDTMAKPEEILTPEDAVKNIINGRGVEKTYTVKEKDTLWDIAIKNNIMLEELIAANPDINIDKIKPGQVIKLAVNLPYVNVETVARIKDKEEIPFDTKEIEDKNAVKGTKKIKQEGRNGLANVEKIVTFLNEDTMDEDVIKSTMITAAVDEVVIVGSKVPLYVASGSFIRPSRGTITSRFGYRWGRMHEGVDIAAPRGTPIVASDSGKVSFSGWRSGYGYCVMINHGNGYQTLYGHASKLYVKAGQSVKKGQKIAAVGSTGRSTGPHLHFEVRVKGVAKNPLKYIK